LGIQLQHESQEKNGQRDFMEVHGHFFKVKKWQLVDGRDVGKTGGINGMFNKAMTTVGFSMLIQVANQN
jgi:hypothetical protein